MPACWSVPRVCSTPCTGLWTQGWCYPGLCNTGTQSRGKGVTGDKAVRRDLEPRNEDWTLPWDVQTTKDAGTGGHRCSRPGVPPVKGHGRTAQTRPGRPAGLGSRAPEAARRRGVGGDQLSWGRSPGTFVGSPGAMRSRVTWMVSGAPTRQALGPSPAAPQRRGEQGVRPRSEAGAPRPRQSPERAVRVLALV